MPGGARRAESYDKVRGSGFYRQYFDNAEWASFMLAGRKAGLGALAALDRGLHRPAQGHVP